MAFFGFMRATQANIPVEPAKKPASVMHPLNVPRTMAQPKGSQNFVYPPNFQDYKLAGITLEQVEVKGALRPAMLARLVHTSRPNGMLVQEDTTASVADMENFRYKDPKTGQVKIGHPQVDQAARVLSHAYETKIAPEQQEKTGRQWAPFNKAPEAKGVAIATPRAAGKFNPAVGTPA